jgi:predicted phosphodiesterase
MRVLVLSDVHADQVALQAVLRKAGAVDETWFLGDIFDRGSSPVNVYTTMQFSVEPKVWLAGNHDLALAGNERCRNDIVKDDLSGEKHRLFSKHKEVIPYDVISEVGSQPTQTCRAISSSLIWFAHGWPDEDPIEAARLLDFDKAPGKDGNADRIFATREKVAPTSRLWLVGHSHRRTAWLWDADRNAWSELIEGFGQTIGGIPDFRSELGLLAKAEHDFENHSDSLLILNPGSVHAPRDVVDNTSVAHFMILNFEARRLIAEFWAVFVRRKEARSVASGLLGGSIDANLP